MSISRRSFLRAATAAAAVPAVTPALRAASDPRAAPTPVVDPRDRGFDPWLEVDPAALRHNAREVGRLAGGRPVLAVVKNEAYGLGLEIAGPALEAAEQVTGLAVVKAAEALRLREAGVRKPILLMGRAAKGADEELARAGVRLAPFGDDDPERLRALSSRLQAPVPVHLYLDTGMSRLGMPFRRATEWLARVASLPGARVEGTFTALTEEDEFDPVQLERFAAVARRAREAGLELGRLHAASSHALFHRGEEARLDMVRPGLALFGAYPAGARAPGRADLRPAFRLRARVVRVERLEAGDGVSYGHNYVAERPTWIATLPAGHADGYPRAAVRRCEVLIGGRTYPVIGAVSASHAIVEVGDEPAVRVGDEAVLVGPDHPSVHPNEVAERAGISVYDVLMHLSARLPRRAAG